jgi:hypothetical protein
MEDPLMQLKIVPPVEDRRGPLKLSKDRWWVELDRSGMPRPLVDALKSAINAAKHSMNSSLATDHQIALAQAYVANGLMIEEEFYALLLTVPDDLEHCGRQFRLVASTPGTKFEFIGG